MSNSNKFKSINRTHYNSARILKFLVSSKEIVNLQTTWTNTTIQTHLFLQDLTDQGKYKIQVKKVIIPVRKCQLLNKISNSNINKISIFRSRKDRGIMEI